MKRGGVAILGLGVVGGGTFEILKQNREYYKEIHGLDINVENVLEKKEERLKTLGVNKSIVAANIVEICSNPQVDIVVEVLGGIEPAKSFIISALNSGKSVVTSNKELFCKYGSELEKVARKNGCAIYYEATCVGGVPIIRALTDNLQGNKFSSMIGIINGTTNFILSKMSLDGASYADVLREAQNLGYAESDPTSDVEGFDSVYKLSILSTLAFRTKVNYTDIYREGITEVQPIDIEYGKKLGFALKLLAIGKISGKGLEVRVHPAFISFGHPLATVNDSYNAVFLTGDCVEDVMLYGRGAGALPTGSAIVGDIIYCAAHENYACNPISEITTSPSFIKNFKSIYYLRICVDDKAGILSKITKLLSKNDISVAQVVQDTQSENKATIVIATHETFEDKIKTAVSEINSLNGVDGVRAVIRIVQ